MNNILKKHNIESWREFEGKYLCGDLGIDYIDKGIPFKNLHKLMESQNQQLYNKIIEAQQSKGTKAFAIVDEKGKIAPADCSSSIAVEEKHLNFALRKGEKVKKVTIIQDE